MPWHCVSIPRLLLTPSRQLVLGFELEMSNRAVRRFTEGEGFAPESFLRVQLADENGQGMFDQDLTISIEVVLKAALLDGICICGRLYEFLAYSSSQLKECGVWMVCCDDRDGWTVGRMRSLLGDFSCCKSPSKYAARIGQCFSTTVQGTPGQDTTTAHTSFLRHRVIDDIWGDESKEKMCHSDGTGLIRRESMNELLRGIPFAPSDPLDVSNIQIRYGGAKGTLTAWDFDELGFCKDRDLCLRPSMIKFDAKFYHLEVCAVGKHVPYFMNRNVILLLSFHQVRDGIFVNMQKEMLDGLDNMMQSREVAMEMVPKLSGPDSTHRSILLHMLSSGFSPTKEPFLFDCLNSIRSHHLFGLRKKARIFVERGAVLVGGLDETGLLPEGTVFFEVWDPNRGLFAPVQGPVMVTSKYKSELMPFSSISCLCAPH